MGHQVDDWRPGVRSRARARSTSADPRRGLTATRAGAARPSAANAEMSGRIAAHGLSTSSGRSAGGRRAHLTEVLQHAERRAARRPAPPPASSAEHQRGRDRGGRVAGADRPRQRLVGDDRDDLVTAEREQRHRLEQHHRDRVVAGRERHRRRSCSCARSRAGRPRCCARCSGNAAATASRRARARRASPPASPARRTRSRRRCAGATAGSPACSLACAATSVDHVDEQAAAAALLRLRGGVGASAPATGPPAIQLAGRGIPASTARPRATRARRLNVALPNIKLTLFPPNANELLSTLRHGRFQARRRDLDPQLGVHRVRADAARDPALLDGDDREHRLGRAARAQQMPGVALGRRHRNAARRTAT